MRRLTLGWFRRSGHARPKHDAALRDVAASAGLEPLEPRVLLSGVGLGALPEMSGDINDGVTVFWGGDYSFNPTEEVRSAQASRVLGTVFLDRDADALRDPVEHALSGVDVFVDLDGDGVLGDAEPVDTTNSLGVFDLWGVSPGEHEVRVVMPVGYKASGDGTHLVQITDSAGVAGLQFALARTGYDLSIELSDVSLPSKFKTGTRLTVPVIVSNLGDLPLSADDIRLRVFVSGDWIRSRDDIRLAKAALGQDLLAGQSVKLDLKVALPSAAADFRSYLIVDAVGKGLNADIDMANNIDVSARSMAFIGSSRPTILTPDQLNLVVANWTVGSPFGGLTPGFGFNDGFIGIEDLNLVLGNWNPGTNPGGALNLDTGVVITFGGITSETRAGDPASILGRVYNDNDGFGWVYSGEGYPGLEGITVYLDDNENGALDAGERSVVTGADGVYLIDQIATEVVDTYEQNFLGPPTLLSSRAIPQTRLVSVVVPDGWHGGDTRPASIKSGEVVGGYNFGLIAPPRIRGVGIEGGHLIMGESNLITAEGVTDPDGTVERVMFFLDRDNDRVADDLLGIDDDGSDGFSVVVDRFNADYGDSANQLFAVARDNDGNWGVSDQSVAASPRLGVEVTQGKKLVYREVDGTVVTVTLNGPGSARVLLVGSGVRAWDLGDVVEITGDANVSDIQLIQTTADSKLMIRTSGGRGKGRVASISEITGSTPLGVLAAGKVQINGGVRMTGQGTIGRLRAASLNGIVMEGTAFGGVEITVGRANGEARIASPVRLLKAGTLSYFNLEAPSADQIVVTGNYKRGSVTLTDPGVRFSLRQLRVGKTLQGVQVRTASSIHTVAAAAMLGSGIEAGGGTGQLATASASGSVAQRGAIVNLSVGGGAFADSYVSAWRLGKVSLNSASHDDPNRLFGLTYHRLRRYRGPQDVDRTVI